MQIFWKWVTKLGGFPGILILLLPIVIMLHPREKWEILRFSFLVFTIVLGIPLLLAALTKLFIHKERPQPMKRGTWRRHILAGSFPSMHTIVVLVIATLVRIFFHTFPFIWRIFPCYLIVAVVVAISRVKLKKHYRIDLLGALFYIPTGFLILNYFIRNMTRGGSGS